MKTFTLEELKEYNGVGKPVYVAYDGKVYDLTQSYHWRMGMHHYMHQSGSDLTGEFARAPHGEEALKKFPVVGVLVQEE